MSKEVNYRQTALTRPAYGVTVPLGALEHVSVEPINDSVPSVIVIERRALIRECLARCISAALGPAIMSFTTVKHWMEVADRTPASVIVLSIGGKWKDPEEPAREIEQLKRATRNLPIILLADAEDPSQIVEALQRGINGYIPTSVSFAIAIEAMRLVRAGGVYAPAGNLIAANGKTTAHGGNNLAHSLFTERQRVVLEALRMGKANKIIAYELNMRESTVKVHVRNIMKKLKARNRTEAVYMAHRLMNEAGR